MNSTCQTAQDKRPANLAALHQTLREMFAATKSAAKEKPVVIQGPVLVVRGKQADSLQSGILQGVGDPSSDLFGNRTISLRHPLFNPP